MIQYSTGLVSVTFRNHSPLEIISEAKNSNLTCIEWGSDIHVPQTDTENAKTIAKATRDAGLSVCSYGSYYRLGANTNFEDYLRCANALGAGIIRIWAGSKASASVSESERLLYVKEARRIARLAAKDNIKVDFEYHPFTLTDDKNSAVRLVNDIGEDNVGLYWQPDFKKSIDEILSGLELALPYIDVLHVFTWKETSERLNLACGADFWKTVFKKIPDLKSKKILLEFVPNDDITLLKGEAHALHSILEDI